LTRAARQKEKHKMISEAQAPVYTRIQAIKECAQIPVFQETAMQAGLFMSVFLTRSVFERYIMADLGVSCQGLQGRLHDVLWMAGLALRRSYGAKRARFQVYVTTTGARVELVDLVAVIGTTDIDNESPAVTIKLPEEN
jgi:hypothetical protein